MDKQNIAQLSLGWLREKSGLLAFSSGCCATGTCICVPKILEGSVIPNFSQKNVDFQLLT